MTRTHYTLFAAAVIAVAAVTGCSSGSTNPQVNALASSTALASAKAKAQAQISGCFSKTSLTSLLTKNGRVALEDCLKALVPPGKQAQFKSCLESAATGDKLWTKAGREKLETVDAPNCVNAAA